MDARIPGGSDAAPAPEWAEQKRAVVGLLARAGLDGLAKRALEMALRDEPLRAISDLLAGVDGDLEQMKEPLARSRAPRRRIGEELAAWSSDAKKPLLRRLRCALAWHLLRSAGPWPADASRPKIDGNFPDFSTPETVRSLVEGDPDRTPARERRDHLRPIVDRLDPAHWSFKGEAIQAVCPVRLAEEKRADAELSGARRARAGNRPKRERDPERKELRLVQAWKANPSLAGQSAVEWARATGINERTVRSMLKKGPQGKDQQRGALFMLVLEAHWNAIADRKPGAKRRNGRAMGRSGAGREETRPRGR